MGSVISFKHKDLKENLLQLESNINKYSEIKRKLIRSKMNYQSKFILFSILFYFILILYLIYAHKNKFIGTIFYLILIYCINFLALLIYDKRIFYYTTVRNKLIEVQKKNIEELKNKTDFLEIKKIISRQEENWNEPEESDASSVFSSTVDLLVGGDKFALICMNCGKHNGYVDFSKYSISQFECVKCKFENKIK